MPSFSPFLIWVDGSWALKDCDGNRARPDAAAWLSENAARLPRPRYLPPQVVSFSFDQYRMRGSIRSIEFYERNDNYSWETPEFKPYMTYTIDGNGHSRWVDEKNIID